MAIRLTIFSKGLILVLVPLLSQLVFILLIYQMLRSNSEAQGWFAHTKEVIAQLHAVEGTLAEAKASVRGLNITGDPAFAEAYGQAARRSPEELASLQDLVRDNPEQEARAAAVAAKASQLMDCLAETKRLARGDDRDRKKLWEKIRTGRALMEDCRQEIAAFLQEEARLEAERRLEVERLQQQLKMLLLGGSVGAILITVLLAFAFNRGIARGFAALTENARRLAQGSDLLPPMAGSDEIARVDRSFHQMAGELAKSENALREQKQVLQSVLDSMADGVVVADDKGKFLLFNPAAERILGVGPTKTPAESWAECYGVFLPDKATLYPTEQLPLVQAMRGETVDAAEMWVRNPAIPEGVWISANARPLRGADGDVHGGVVVFRDVSQSKQAEEAIRRLNEELEQRVVERTASLAQANRELAQRSQENELFVYSVSHDLRSPLVNLEGFSQELGLVCKDLRSLLTDDGLPAAVRDQGLALLDSDMSESLRFIRAGVRRLSNIIDGLLRLSRAGRVQHQYQCVELRAVVTRVIESLQATIAERGATVTVADLPPVWGDSSAVEQIFANLLGNALNYLEPGRPGIIEIGRVSAPGTEEAHGQPPLQTAYVKDNGLGISESYRPKVFQAFQRLHPTAASGEGIGLTLVRRVVERLGGRIWFDSTEGVGTTFFVSLPAPPASATPHDHRLDEAGTPTQEQAHEDGTVLDPVG